jgi:hypothetical protein
MRPWTRLAALLAAFSVVPSIAHAQVPTDTPAPAAQTSDDAGGAPSAPPASSYPATGYGWTTPTTHSAPARASPPPAGSSDATMSGFERLDDGSSRLFVELTKPVSFETRKTRHGVTYVLKNTHVSRANNRNPLVTVHFKTPVTSARLVPHGKDLWFVIHLRADVEATATMDRNPHGPSVLRIAFAKGDYGAASSSSPHSPTAPTKPSRPHVQPPVAAVPSSSPE